MSVSSDEDDYLLLGLTKSLAHSSLAHKNNKVPMFTHFLCFLLCDKKIIVFLDYDGTLSPIVDDPDRAFMSAEMRSAVRNAATHFPTAIISGRKRDMAYELVGLAELYYAGSHGMDIKFPLKDTGEVSIDHLKSGKLCDQQDKEFNLFQPAREYLPMIEEVDVFKAAKVEVLELEMSSYPVLYNKPIDQWKVTELKELRKRRLPIKGLKNDLIRRLDESLQQEIGITNTSADQGFASQSEPVVQYQEATNK